MGFCIYANEDVVQIEENAGIDRSVGGEGLIELKKDSDVSGDVVGREDIKIEEKATVGGDATAAGQVEIKDGATVAGTVTSGAAIAAVTQVSVDVNAGGPNIRVRRNQTRSLSPGSYGELTVKEGATLQLSSGQYAFKEIIVDKEATIELDLSAGYVVIGVSNNVNMKEEVEMVVTSPTGSAADILWQVEGGDVKLGKSGSFLGTFIAPNAHIDMEEGASLTGLLYGQKVQVKKDVGKITGDPALEAFIDLFLP